MRQVANDNGKPLTETVFLLLLSLQGGPMHGYGLMKDIAAVSEGRVKLTTGTLYGAIKRLLEDGWIVPFEQEDSSRDKKAYKLTRSGRRQLHTEIKRLRQLMAVVSLRASEV